MLDQKHLAELIKQSVDIAVEKFVEETVDSLTMNQQWIQRIENILERSMLDRVGRSLSNLDLNVAIENSVLNNKDAIIESFKSQFESAGIKDIATKTELTVMDGVIVIEGETVTHDLTVERNTHFKGDVLINGDLAVQGRINVDNKTWQDLTDYAGEQAYQRFKESFAGELLNSVIESTRRGIEIQNITIQGSPLVVGDQLSTGIKKSSLNEVGELSELTVKGTTNLDNTLFARGNRVGINTTAPDSALTIWDEEISLKFGKFSSQKAYIGTSRNQNVVIGTNGQNYLEIDADGEVTVQKFRLGKNSLSYGVEVPNYSGTKGDIVFNTNVKPGDAFAWMCLGSYRWLPLKAA